MKIDGKKSDFSPFRGVFWNDDAKKDLVFLFCF